MNQLGLFARYWEPGRAKTRLAAGIGPEAAAGVHRVFVETLASRLAGVADRCVIAHTPDDTGAAFGPFESLGWRLEPQGEGDLGQRMERYFQRALATGSSRVVLIGADSPDLPRDLIVQAFTALEGTHVVIGPSPDGGYYLVGARDRAPPIFEGVDWGSPRVLDQTIDRLAAEGVEYAMLPPWADVDVVSDLVELRQRLRLATPGQPGDPSLNTLAERIDDALRGARWPPDD